MYFSLVAISLAGAVAASPLSTPPTGAAAGSPWSLAPLIADAHPHGSLNDSYIVVFKSDAQRAPVDHHMNFLAQAHTQSFLAQDVDAGLRQVYDGHVRGYAGKFAPATVEAIRAMPEVAYIEHDQVVRISDEVDHDTQRGAPWVSHPRPQ
jgi:cerevisin